MAIISYIHKSVELLFKILGLVEVWTHRSMELSPSYISYNNLHTYRITYIPYNNLHIVQMYCIYILHKDWLWPYCPWSFISRPLTYLALTRGGIFKQAKGRLPPLQKTELNIMLYGTYLSHLSQGLNKF